MSRVGGQPRGAGGFTLLELVVAMAMVAVIALALSACLHIAFAASKRAQEAVQPSHDAELAMEFLRNDLQNACVPSPPFLGSYVPFQGVNQTSGSGEADDVLFFSTADARDHADANGDIKLIELTTEADPGGGSAQVLIRRVTRNLLSPGGTPSPENIDTEILCRGVVGFSVSYYDGTTWYNSWGTTDNTAPTPLAVQVTLTLNRPGAAPGTAPFQFVRFFNLACTPPSSNDLLNMGGL